MERRLSRAAEPPLVSALTPHSRGPRVPSNIAFHLLAHCTIGPRAARHTYVTHTPPPFAAPRNS
eukprot:1513618-Prymnesium_polylepis.1